jgi:diguanylate cyclase (GGDEF)-like protein
MYKYAMAEDYPAEAYGSLTLAEIAEDRRREAEAQRQRGDYWQEAATRDSLTGLPNRAWLMAELDRQAESQPGNFALLFTDIDGLKSVNDNQGHEAGNQLLTQAAAALAGSVRSDEDRQPDKLAHAATRLAGDEFVLLLAGVSDQDTLDAIKQRVEAALEQTGVSASIGGRPHRQGETGAELLAATDELMYQQKQQRREQRVSELPPKNRLLHRLGKTLIKLAGIASER